MVYQTSSGPWRQAELAALAPGRAPARVPDELGLGAGKRSGASPGRSAVKPAPFTYHLAHDVAEAIALLTELGEDAKILAGGQSLVPMMNLRLARPSALVDITRI